MRWDRLADEPYSRTARWSARFGVFSMLVTGISLLVVRSGHVEPASGFAALGAGLLLAMAAVMFGALSLGIIWVRGKRGARAAMWGVFTGALVLVVPMSYLMLAFTLPPIHDITTDPGRPPEFIFAAAGRESQDNSTVYPGPRTALDQLAAYPDIVPLRLAIPPKEAHALALEQVTDHKWRILDQGSASNLRIEAVARTPWLGFEEDIVIRIQPDGAGSRVDMRSASRFGQHDFGSNARRIRSFIKDLEEAAR